MLEIANRSRQFSRLYSSGWVGARGCHVVLSALQATYGLRLHEWWQVIQHNSMLPCSLHVCVCHAEHVACYAIASIVQHWSCQYLDTVASPCMYSWSCLWGSFQGVGYQGDGVALLKVEATWRLMVWFESRTPNIFLIWACSACAHYPICCTNIWQGNFQEREVILKMSLAWCWICYLLVYFSEGILFWVNGHVFVFKFWLKFACAHWRDVLSRRRVYRVRCDVFLRMRCGCNKKCITIGWVMVLFVYMYRNVSFDNVEESFEGYIWTNTTNLHACIHPYMHLYMHTYIHTHTLACIYTFRSDLNGMCWLIPMKIWWPRLIHIDMHWYLLVLIGIY